MLAVDQWAVGLRGLHGPAWRWQLAQRRTKTPKVLDDPDVRATTAYLSDRGQAALGTELARRVAQAVRLEENASLSAKLKTLVIGNCPRAEAAALLGQDQEVLRLWESLFFDVRPALSAIDWIFGTVIQAEQVGGNAELGSQLKMAFAGGPLAARALLEVATLPRAAGERCFARMVQLHLKFDQAMEMSAAGFTDPFTFVQFYSQLKIQQQKVELARQRLAARCQESLHRHERARARQLHREQARAARKKRLHPAPVGQASAAQGQPADSPLSGPRCGDTASSTTTAAHEHGCAGPDTTVFPRLHQSDNQNQQQDQLNESRPQDVEQAVAASS